MKGLMRIIFTVVGVLLICSYSARAAGTVEKEFVNSSVKLPEHPRLLLLKGEEKKLKKQIAKDSVWTKIHGILLNEADRYLTLPVNERIKVGRRLLDVSRDNLKRIFILSYAYRMTKDKKYAVRAQEEMLKAASFEDWNPSHFLDVGEMTMALAIGYDWLYSFLDSETRNKIEKAITEQGLKQSFDEAYNWFIDAGHNWNQVCHAGMAYGALAIWEKDADFASKIVNRAIDKISIPMKHYGPDGAYPEGVGYWDYGTSFNVMFLSAIEKIFGTDYGLSEMPGFLKTGEYLLHAVTPGLRNFSYSDNGSRAGIYATLFWFYDKTKNPAILYNQALLYQKEGLRSIERLAPAMLIWGASASLGVPVKPTEVFWKAGGDNPVCFMRSGWETNQETYLGVKLGSPSVNHGHMDIGSFIFEANGVNWAIDLGADNYNQLEQKGVDLWNMKQESQRWDVFRYNNFAHNTLAFNEKRQNVGGKAEIERSSDIPDHMYVVSDLTPVYKEQVKSVKRSCSLVDKKYGVIEDEIVSKNRFTKMTWSLVTPATASVVSDKTIVLERDGKKLYLRVEGPEKIKWNIRPAVSSFSYDSPNKGISIVSFDTDLKRDAKQKIYVYLLPDEDKEIDYQPVL